MPNIENSLARTLRAAVDPTTVERRPDTWPVTADDIEELRAQMQQRLPLFWNITMLCEMAAEHHQLIAYHLLVCPPWCDVAHLIIGVSGGGLWPKDWTVEHINHGTYDAVNITSPDGETVTIDDELLS
jgi:hypothetical protein